MSKALFCCSFYHQILFGQKFIQIAFKNLIPTFFFVLDFLTPEGGTHRLSRNDAKGLPLDAA